MKVELLQSLKCLLIIYIYIYKFIYCWAGSSLLHELFSVVASRGYSLGVVHRLLLAVAFCRRAWALGCAGFRSCGGWAL